MIPKKSLTAALMRVAHGLWPVKPDLALAAKTLAGDRACRAWLAGRGGMSLEAFDNLLATDDGLPFLRALMERRAVVPAWWAELEQAIELADLVRRQKRQGRELDRLVTKPGE